MGLRKDTDRTEHVQPRLQGTRIPLRSLLRGLGALTAIMAMCATLLPGIAAATNYGYSSGHNSYSNYGGHSNYGYSSGHSSYGYSSGHSSSYGSYGGHSGYGYFSSRYVLVCHERSNGSIVTLRVRARYSQYYANTDLTPQFFYRDRDRDGFTPTWAAKRVRCTPSSRWIAKSPVADCNDWNKHISPAATEIPGNGIDDDCDPSTPDTVVVNTAPTVTSPGDQTNTAGDLVAVFISAVDSDGDPLTFSASGLPVGTSINTSTGEITGATNVAGTYSVTVTVDDGQGAIDTATFTWTVIAPNSAPVITSPGGQTNNVGDGVSIPLLATDADGDALAFTAANLPPGLTITGNVISGAVTTPGTYTTTVTVSDGQASDTTTITWTVIAPNSAPVITSPGGQTNNVGDGVSIPLLATDADGDALAFTTTGLPPGLTITGNVISGTVTTPGTYTATVTVSDGQTSDTTTFTWTVFAPNNAPVITSPGDQTSDQFDSVAVPVPGTDADFDLIVFSATGLPVGTSINTNTGEITGSTNVAGTYNVTVTVTDGNLSDTTTFTWTVNQFVNSAPVITSPGDQTNNVGDGVSIPLLATDADGDALSFTAAGLPPGLTITGNVISGTVTTPGTYTATVTVSDGQTSDTTTFTWIVIAPNTAPVITSPGAQASSVGDSVTVPVVGADADGDLIVFSATGLPLGTSINTNTGEITGSTNVAGTNNVTVTVTDGNLSDTTTFTWTVFAPNTAPIVTSPGDQTSTEFNSVAVPVVGADADGDLIVFSATGLPVGTSINTNTGEITGSTNVAGTYTVSVTVTDGNLSDTTTFTWTVDPYVNFAPVVTSPGDQTNIVGDVITIPLMATDANGDALSISAANLPPGLSITGNAISGTVTTPGTYTTTVTVSDGQTTGTTTFVWTVN